MSHCVAQRCLRWASTPAVYMQQVLAAADQKSQKITPIVVLAVTQTQGPITGGTTVTITGSGLPLQQVCYLMV